MPEEACDSVLVFDHTGGRATRVDPPGEDPSAVGEDMAFDPGTWALDCVARALSHLSHSYTAGQGQFHWIDHMWQSFVA